jgi:putative membrane protein
MFHKLRARSLAFENVAWSGDVTGTVGWWLRSGPLPGVAGPSVVFGDLMMFWFGDGMSGWGYGLMVAGMVVFWALVVLGVVGLVRYLAGVDRSVLPRQVAEQVLAERFARGDIDEPEYRQRLDGLRGGAGIGAAP